MSHARPAGFRGPPGSWATKGAAVAARMQWLGTLRGKSTRLVGSASLLPPALLVVPRWPLLVTPAKAAIPRLCLGLCSSSPRRRGSSAFASASARHPREGGDPATLLQPLPVIPAKAGIQRLCFSPCSSSPRRRGSSDFALALARHPREGGDPAPLLQPSLVIPAKVGIHGRCSWLCPASIGRAARWAGGGCDPPDVNPAFSRAADHPWSALRHPQPSGQRSSQPFRSRLLLRKADAALHRFACLARHPSNVSEGGVGRTA